MKPEIKEIIYSQLKEAQEKYGGYTGKDIAIISRKINRQPKTVRRQIEKLRDKNASFSDFTYIGKRYIDLTLEEISFLQYRLQDNCLMLKSLLLEELNKRRIEEGKSQIPPSTFYKFLGNLMILRGEKNWNSMDVKKNNHF
jgi:plasmid stabilization system protein ParE